MNLQTSFKEGIEIFTFCFLFVANDSNFFGEISSSLSSLLEPYATRDIIKYQLIQTNTITDFNRFPKLPQNTKYLQFPSHTNFCFACTLQKPIRHFRKSNSVNCILINSVLIISNFISTYFYQ